MGVFVEEAAGVFVVGAFEEGGNKLGADTEAKAAPEPHLDASGCRRGRNLSPEVAAPQSSQEDPPEGRTGATVVEPDPSAEGTAGKWDVVAGADPGSVILVWVSRAGQETGPGSSLVGKMEAVFWRTAEGRASTRSPELESD